MSPSPEDRPTLLLIGEGDPMQVGLEEALDRHGLAVECVKASEASGAVVAAAPDLVLLLGDAAMEGGGAVLRELAGQPGTSVVPVAVLSADTELHQRLSAFRSGAVAVVPRGASVDAIATRVAELCRELPNRPGGAAGELGEATLEELLGLVSKELRSGILSVEPSTAGSEAVRLVLGAGGPVAQALEEFVTKLRPLIEKAEPMRYELLEASGGRLRLFDEDEPANEGDLSILRGLRILLMDNDPGRADVLAQTLRDHGTLVAVARASVEGLQRARGLDPEVVILDATAIEGDGFEAVRAIRRGPRLRWASLLVVRWEELWPADEATPDLVQLAARIGKLTENDRDLRHRARSEDSFDTRLELTGPSRLLRNLARVPGTRHAAVRSREASVDVDLSDGLVVGATGMRLHGDDRELLAGEALAALLSLGSARVHVEKVGHPSIANLMTPVDEALDAAAREASPLALEERPAPSDEASDRQDRKRPSPLMPFPSAASLKQGVPMVGEDDDEGVDLSATGTGPVLSEQVRSANVDPPRAAPGNSGGMSWEGGENRRSAAPTAPPEPPPETVKPEAAKPASPETVPAASPAAEVSALAPTMMSLGAAADAAQRTRKVTGPAGAFGGRPRVSTGEAEAEAAAATGAGAFGPGTGKLPALPPAGKLIRKKGTTLGLSPPPIAKLRGKVPSLGLPPPPPIRVSAPKPPTPVAGAATSHATPAGAASPPASARKKTMLGMPAGIGMSAP